MVELTKPLPHVDDDNREYWEYCKNHDFRMQKCTSCGYIRFPCSIVCPECHSMEAEWTKLSGKGKVYTFTVYRRPYHPAYKDDIPYVLAIIELEEGPRMESNVTGCPVEEVKIDMPVEVYFDDVTPEFAIPKFRPSK